MDEFNGWVIQPSDQRINLKDSIDLILNFNKELNQIWFKKYKNEQVIFNWKKH